VFLLVKQSQYKSLVAEPNILEIRVQQVAVALQLYKDHTYG
jgi:hypothetical protein